MWSQSVCSSSEVDGSSAARLDRAPGVDYLPFCSKWQLATRDYRMFTTIAFHRRDFVFTMMASIADLRDYCCAHVPSDLLA